MREKIKRSRALWVILALAAVAGGILSGDGKRTVRAESEQSFFINAEMLPSDRETYDIRVTVENPSADWEGTVRLMVEEDYRKPSAYDTVISLAQGSKKQFSVRVPRNSVDSTDGTVVITLLNKKNQKTAGKEFKGLLSGNMDTLSMGILSDGYPALTYLDMGGEKIYYYGDRYPIKLVELNQDNLADSLGGLTFLVIDKYNTGILTDEEMENIESWNEDGGVLIVGTGAYAEDTLSGFDGGYLGVSCTAIHTPDDRNLYDADTGSYMDWSKLTLAELQTAGYGQNDYIGGWSWSVGDGSVAVLPYSLTQLGQTDMAFYPGDTRENFVMSILDEICMYAGARYTAPTAASLQNINSTIRRMLGVMGNCNNRLQFGVLKALVILYVVLVGPVLYLILRFLKKRELYWVAVPVTALLGIGVIFLAGRGFEVVNTKVYSVTVEDLSGREDKRAYLYCYDASHREWDLGMAAGYEYAGTLGNSSYYDDSDKEAYYYHIKKEGDTLSLGIKPTSNFEDSYFYVGGTDDGSPDGGAIVTEGVTVDWMGLRGTVTNVTNRDFSYFAVVADDALYIFEDLPAGESLSLGETAIFYEDTWDNFRISYVYDLLDDNYTATDPKKTSALSALGVGICAASSRMDYGTAMVIGVTDDCEKTVDDACSEISYGCLYTVW